MNLFSGRSDVGAAHYNSLLRTLLSLLLVAALPVFIWAVMTQRIELRKRAATSEPPVVCWNRVGGQPGGYYWPDGCKGNPDTTRMCTMATVPLDATETYNYLQWVNAGKPYIPGCMGTPTPTASNSTYQWKTQFMNIITEKIRFTSGGVTYGQNMSNIKYYSIKVSSDPASTGHAFSLQWDENGKHIGIVFSFGIGGILSKPDGKFWQISSVLAGVDTIGGATGPVIRFQEMNTSINPPDPIIYNTLGSVWTSNLMKMQDTNTTSNSILEMTNVSFFAFPNGFNPTPTWTPSPTPSQLTCGGITGKVCPVGYVCTYTGGSTRAPFPDAMGTCIRPTVSTPTPVSCANNGSTCQMTACKGTDVKICSTFTGLCKNNVCNPPPVGCTYQMVRCLQAPCEPVLNCTTPYTCDSLSQSQQFYFTQCATQGFSGTCMNKNTGGFQGCSNLGFNNDCTVNNTNAAQNLLCPVALNPSALNCTREPEFSLTPATTSSGVVGGSILWDYVLRNTNDPGCAPASYSFYMEQFPQVANIGHLESPDYFTLTSGSVQYGSFKVSSQAPTQQNAYEIGKIYKFLVRPVRAQRNSNGSTSYLQHFAPFTREFVFNNSSSVSPTPPISCLNARDGAPCTTNSCETIECNASGVCLTRRSVGISCTYGSGVCQTGRCVTSITPSPTCMPRPACMDPLPGQPACMPKMLPGSWFCPQTPTPSTNCKTGVNSFAVGDNCAGTDTYKSATYACYDGFSSKIVMAACQTSVSLANLAQQACVGHSACTTPSISAGKVGDLNGDSKVNLYDFNILLNNFGKTGKPGFVLADLNKDGSVNLLDFNLLLKYFE